MMKIPTIYEREQVSKKKALCVDKPNPLAAWVFAGEGIATRKWDGTACMVRAGKLYKRYDAGKSKVIPAEFIQAEDPGPDASHWVGWVPVRDGPDDKWHAEAWMALPAPLPDGTYELIGPKVNGNPERQQGHRFIRHGDDLLPDAPRDFDGLRAWLTAHPLEGIVWHHPDGRMAKLKRRDFDIPWPPSGSIA